MAVSEDPIPTTPRTIGAVGALVQTIRPDWTSAGIHSALTQMLRDYSLDRVLTVAIRGAKDAVIRTPAAVALPGPHWHEETTARSATNPTPQPPPANTMIADWQQHRGHLSGEETQTHAALARAALHGEVTSDH